MDQKTVLQGNCNLSYIKFNSWIHLIFYHDLDFSRVRRNISFFNSRKYVLDVLYEAFVAIM